MSIDSGLVRALVFVAAAFALGALGAALLFPPTLAPPAAATEPPQIPTPTPTPIAEDDPRVFAQPLVAGCAIGEEAYVVSLGGGIARFDGKHWSLIDRTLRDLNAVACTEEAVVAVGNGGRVVWIDRATRTIRAETVDSVDLFAVHAGGPSAEVAFYAVAVGEDRVVLHVRSGAWTRVGQGERGDGAWRAILPAGPERGFIAGDAGLVFHFLFFRGVSFDDYGSMADGPDLVGMGLWRDGPLVAAADGRVFEHGPDPDDPDVLGWRPFATVSGAVTALHSDRLAGDAYLVTTDGIVMLRGEDRAIEPLHLGLACVPHALFGDSRELAGAGTGDLWVIGRGESGYGIARRSGDEVRRWGAC